MRRLPLLALLTLLAPAALGGCKRAAPPADAPLRVAAASDLSEAFPEIGKAYEAKTGQKVSFTFGATGMLAKQIAEGAPYDLFAAANLSFVDDAIKAGACDGATKTVYAEGRIVLWSKADAGVTLASIADLAKPEVVHVAIANPEHAPYGKAAKQALERSGVWASIEKKVVFGENVQQTFQFAQSGNAEVAIIALSLATVSGGRMVPIDPALHDPLLQGMVACHGAAGSSREEDAKKLEAFVESDDGRAIMKKYGFSRSAEAAAAAARGPI
jgi:molybdate transport system substrate-binding protein